jgi:Tfp pilus assembly PilM family ATPase
MALSIEIRNGFVYLVEARTTRTSVTIQKTHYYSFPEEWVTETGINNPEGFSSLLLQHMKEQNIRDKKAFVCINNGSVIYRELNLPRVEDRKIPLLVRTEMMSALNLTPDYIMDYVYLNEVESEGAMYYRVLGVAMLKTAIESIVDVAKRCKLQLQVIDSATNSILKLVQDNKLIQESDQLIIADVGNGHLKLYLYENGQYALSRNNKLISYKENSNDEMIGSIVDNINKMVQFSYTRKLGTDSKRVVLCGIDELLEDLQKQVSENLLIECEILKKPYFVNGSKFENRYVNAIGTLLRK